MAVSEALEDHGRSWTVEELLARQEHPSHDRIELVGGAVIVSPAPTWPHQAASYELTFQIKTAIRAAKAPFRVAEAVNVRSKDQLFIPDVVVAEATAVSRKTKAVDISSVLLIVEIVSRGNAGVDRVLKPNEYAGLGLRHYWRLEPWEATPRLIAHILEGGHYREVDSVTETASIPVDDLFTVDVDVPQLFADVDQE